FATFNDLFGNFLGFVIPLIIIGFIAPGIGSMGRGAGKMLGLTGAIAYISTIIAGILAFFTAKSIYAILLKGQSLKQFADPTEGLTRTFFTVDIPPPMQVMTALILALVIGLDTAVIKGNTLLTKINDF